MSDFSVQSVLDLLPQLQNAFTSLYGSSSSPYGSSVMNNRVARADRSQMLSLAASVMPLLYQNQQSQAAVDYNNRVLDWQKEQAQKAYNLQVEQWKMQQDQIRRQNALVSSNTNFNRYGGYNPYTGKYVGVAPTVGSASPTSYGTEISGSKSDS